MKCKYCNIRTNALSDTCGDCEVLRVALKLKQFREVKKLILETFPNAYISSGEHCVVCGNLVCKLEDCSEHPDTRELTTGEWVCSKACWEQEAARYD